METPLKGYRILDFSKLLPGPLATLWMAQRGAEVIKVESSFSPDPIRFYPPIKDGVSVYYSTLNAGKKSISLDYREKDGAQKILELAKDVDVVVEQFRPGVMDEFGLGYEAFKKVNNGIVYASITGYGQSGGMAQMPGHDLNYLAYSGVLDGIRDNDGRPVIPTSQVADIAGGSMSVMNEVSLALLHKERTGEGQHIDVAMTASIASLQLTRIAEMKTTGEFEGMLCGRLASYNIYKCADGRYVVLAALEPKFWQKFCDLIDKPDWAGRLMEEELVQEVASLFSTKPMQHWVDELENLNICLSPVLTLDEAMNGQFFNDGFPLDIHWDALTPASELGAHNAKILG